MRRQIMSNNKWMDDPVLNGISNEKLEMLTKIIEGAKGMEPKQMLTYFIQQFNVLKEDMSPEEVKRIDMVKKIVEMVGKKNR